jgi:hypothetical protein
MENVLLAHVLVTNRASTEGIDVFIDLNKGTVYLSSELFPFLGKKCKPGKARERQNDGR